MKTDFVAVELNILCRLILCADLMIFCADLRYFMQTLMVMIFCADLDGNDILCRLMICCADLNDLKTRSLLLYEVNMNCIKSMNEAHKSIRREPNSIDNTHINTTS